MSTGCLPVSSLAGRDVYINVSAELLPKCPVPEPLGSLTGPRHGTPQGASQGVSHTVFPLTRSLRGFLRGMGSHAVYQDVLQEITLGAPPAAPPGTSRGVLWVCSTEGPQGIDRSDAAGQGPSGRRPGTLTGAPPPPQPRARRGGPVT